MGLGPEFFLFKSPDYPEGQKFSDTCIYWGRFVQHLYASSSMMFTSIFTLQAGKYLRAEGGLLIAQALVSRYRHVLANLLFNTTSAVTSWGNWKHEE